MFTGLVEDIGILKAMQSDRDSMKITVQSAKIAEDVKLGDSIAVNGVCLTVTYFTEQTLTMDVMPETVNATNLQQLVVGDSVNLERAMPANGRFGGHFVAGHVDGVGKIFAQTSSSQRSLYRYRIVRGTNQILHSEGFYYD